MAIIIEVGPVFSTEDSYTHRHLCEFVGLDADMIIKEPYPEVEINFQASLSPAIVTSFVEICVNFSR